MKKTVIVGAGPIGLIAAIKLTKMGVKNIVVVDPRAGTYTRAGNVNEAIFKAIGEDLIGTVLPHSASRHIKDFERELYRMATEEFKIEIIKEKFESIHDEHVLVADEKGHKREIPCETILDVSGSSRSVIKAVNQRYLHKQITPFEPVRFAEILLKII